MQLDSSTITSAEENQDPLIGQGKGNAFITAIKASFGLDLSDYTYISHGELWVMGEGEISQELKPVLDISTDLFVEAEEGDKIPLGYLYREDVAYTLVEQSDGSFDLVKYQLISPAAIQNSTAETLIGEPDIPLYRVAETKTAGVSENLLNALYKE